MSAYFEYLRQMLEAFFIDLGIFLRKVFVDPWYDVGNNFTNYNSIFSAHQPEFGFWGWFFWVLFLLVFIGVIGAICFGIHLLLRKYIRFVKKEIDKEEGTRQGIYKEYLKSMGIGFLAKKNDEKCQNAMLKMNEQVRKLHGLYEELKDMDISYQISNLSESATLYDLFLTILKSFPFLEKSFLSNEDFQEKSLEENVEEFFRFLYNPNNDFLCKINAFADYNVTDVVAEKYKLLGLNITNEMINIDNIDSTLESIRFVNLVQNVNRSNTNFHQIDNLYKMSKIVEESASDTPES